MSEVSKCPHCKSLIIKDKGRAEPIEALLRMTKQLLVGANATYLGDEYIYALRPMDVGQIVSAIDAALTTPGGN